MSWSGDLTNTSIFGLVMYKRAGLHVKMYLATFNTMERINFDLAVEKTGRDYTTLISLLDNAHSSNCDNNS